jgi:hypothetical protein
MRAGGIKCQRASAALSYISCCCCCQRRTHTHEQIMCAPHEAFIISTCPLYTIYFLSDKRRTDELAAEIPQPPPMRLLLSLLNIKWDLSAEYLMPVTRT